MQMKSNSDSSASEGANINYGLAIGYDWQIRGTDVSLGPQINVIGSNLGPSLQTSGLVAVKFGFL